MNPKNKSAKKSIYVDVDEEITGIIDKVRSAGEPIIALVVPKRASVFSSIVNLKLLKRAAEQSKKRIVLITSDSSVLPIAGVVGLHVASNLNSKPYVPKAPEIPESNESTVDNEPIQIDTAAAVAAAALAESAKPDKAEPKEEIPTIAVEQTAAGAKDAKAAVKVKKPKKQKFKVPNFNRFRVLFIGLIILVILLGAGGYWALALAPKATVTLKGQTDKKSLNFKFTADTAAKELNQNDSIVPAETKEINKTETQTVPTTGEKDKGNKASGTVSLQNCSRSDGSVDIPAGTGISADGLTYITQNEISLDPSSFNGLFICDSPTQEVDVIAQNGGEKYNVDSQSYTVAGYSGVRAEGSEMKGGTSDIVKVVSNADIETAKTKLQDKTNGATEELKAALKAEGYVPLEDTFNAQTGKYTNTPDVDSEASQVVVTVDVKYTMLGVKKSDLQKLIADRAQKDAGVDTSKQSILDDGLSKASFQLGALLNTQTDVNIATNIVAGPQLDQNAIKAEIAGKKRTEAEELLKSRPGVKEATVVTKPFWVGSIPKNDKKVTIIIEDSDGAQTKP